LARYNIEDILKCPKCNSEILIIPFIKRKNQNEMILKLKCLTHGTYQRNVIIDINKMYLLKKYLFRCIKCGSATTILKQKTSGPWTLYKMDCKNHKVLQTYHVFTDLLPFIESPGPTPEAEPMTYNMTSETPVNMPSHVQATVPSATKPNLPSSPTEKNPPAIQTTPIKNTSTPHIQTFPSAAASKIVKISAGTDLSVLAELEIPEINIIDGELSYTSSSQVDVASTLAIPEIHIPEELDLDRSSDVGVPSSQISLPTNFEPMIDNIEEGCTEPLEMTSGPENKGLFKTTQATFPEPIEPEVPFMTETSEPTVIPEPSTIPEPSDLSPETTAADESSGMEKESADMIICPECGQQTLKDSFWCGNCGIEMQTIEASSAKITFEPKVAENIVCSACGAYNSPSAAFCLECGTEIITTPPVDETTLQDKYCPECGAKNNGDAKFCSECGNSF